MSTSQRVKIVETHGGSSGTDYIYFIVEDELQHVSMIKGVEKLGEKRIGGRRKIVEWSIPANEIAGCEGLLVSFSRRGRYPYIRYFRLPQNLSDINEISFMTLYEKKFIDESIRDPLTEVVLKRNLEIRLFGPEKNQVSLYMELVPRLVKDLWQELKGMGIYDVFPGGHAQRLMEVLDNPRLGLYLSLIMPTPQGRIRSLHEKITRVYEIWLLSKVLKSLYELGAKPLSTELWIEPVTNRPAMSMRYGEGSLPKVILVYYQPSIIPHITGMIVPKRVHAIPDIALLVTYKHVADIIEARIDWGELHKCAKNIVLLVEAKLSLSGTTEYESIDTVVNQVKTYRKLLENIPEVLVPIYFNNPSAVYILNRIEGVTALDNVNPDNQARVREFMDRVKEIALKFLRQT